MSWRGDRVEGDRRVFGSNIDYLIENAPGDVIVFKTQGLRKPLKRIVVWTSPIWSPEGIDDVSLILPEQDHEVVGNVGLPGVGAGHDRALEAGLEADRAGLFLPVSEGAPEGVAGARLGRLEVGVGILGQDAKRAGDGSHGRPSRSQERAGRAAVRDGLIAATRAPPNPRLATAWTQEDGRPFAREDGPAGGATCLRPDHDSRDGRGV